MISADPFVSKLQEWIEVFMRRSMRNFLQYTRKSGLSMSQFGALFQLHHQGSMGVSDLGEHLGVTSAAASQLLDRLFQQELILREEDPDDRRVKQITMTNKGLELIQDSFRARTGWLIGLGERMSEGEKKQVVEGLSILIDIANKHEDQIELECY